jgi:TldD protein
MHVRDCAATLLAPHALDEQPAAGRVRRDHGASRRLRRPLFPVQPQRGWSLEEGIVKSGSFNIDQGVGVRAVSGEKTAFAYSDDISLAALQSAAQATRAIARQGGGEHRAVASAAGACLYAPQDPLASLGRAGQGGAARAARAHCARARSARDAGDGVARRRVRGGAGRAQRRLQAADVRPLVRLSLQVIVEQDGRREQGSAGGGGRFDYAYFTDEILRRSYAQKAVHQALVNLDARPAPAGTMTVVLGPGWPGVLLHEAIGHGLEGDFNRKGTSAFSGRIGERVAAPGVTVVDDGTIARRRGSLNVDDEGNPTQRNVLIEDGVLRGYLQDSLNARLMACRPTGNGRRESYAHIPMPRMTNTYMLNGDRDPQEIIAR